MPLLGFDFSFFARNLILMLIIIIIIFLTLRKIFEVYQRNLIINKIPGPVAFPVVGNLIEVIEPKDKLLENIMKSTKKYGPVFKIWMGWKPVVILSGAEEIGALIKNNKNSKKSFYYEFLQPWLGTGLLTSHGNKWEMRRKLITPSFHFTVLQSFIEVFQENVNILIKKLEEKADTGKEFDVYSLVTLCSLDIICEAAMGIKVNAQPNSQSKYVQSVYRLSSSIVYRMARVWLYPNYLFHISSLGRQQQKHLNVVHRFSKKIIKKKRNVLTKLIKNEAYNNLFTTEKKRLTFLDLLLMESIGTTGAKLTDKDIQEEVDTFMFEGQDTTTSAISWMILVLSHYRQIQEDVYNEIKVVFESKKENFLNLTDLAEMKLLERVFKETLRLFPSVTNIGRMVQEDVWLGNYLVPKGTNVIINIYALHRDSAIYPNPEVFDPDRFLPENSANRHPFAYIPFSAGPRNCIGQKFAMYEGKIVLSNLLLRYRFESVGTLEDVKKIPELVLRPKNGIWVKIYKR